MSFRERMESKLTEALTPDHLEIIDESALHAGHAGARPGGETHFRIVIVAKAFEGVARIQRHRMVNEAVAEELAERVHALSLRPLSPDEWAADQSKA